MKNNNKKAVNQKFPPIHPGEILRENFFKPRNLTVEQVSEDINIPLYQLQDLIAEKRDIDTDIAYRLGLYFKVGVEGFLNLQQYYNLEVWKDRQEKAVKKQVNPYQEVKRSKANFL
jgi:antitoxin HigA-1